jgi:hypothetical protein
MPLPNPSDLRSDRLDLPLFRISAIGRRIKSMVLVWLGLGAVVGVLSAPPDGGSIGLLAGSLAGMIVLPAPGAVLGLLGGRWRETLVGSGCGLVSGIAVAILSGNTRLAPSVSLHLLIGACAGATLPQLCRLQLWVAVQVRAQLRSLRTDPPGASGISAVSPDGVDNP